MAALRGHLGEVALVSFVVLVVAALVLPLPTLALDLLLTLNLALALVLLLVALSTRGVARLGALPSVLLLATLGRLALNVASTRLILLDADAGALIDAFGRFLVQGDYLVGAVIFLILTLINFLVIARGSERIAEVAARFSLDALPGRQMAIDADLRAGAIDLNQARHLRQELQRESGLYGAMDGAMKFIKGDAVAGLVMIAVNILGGLLLGVARRGMDLGEAARVYTLLTVGDGLVSQIPALLVSTAAGVVVTRVASQESHLGDDIAAQLGAHPRALGGAALILALLGLAPGLPLLPLWTLGLALGALAWWAWRRQRSPQGAASSQEATQPWLLLRAQPARLPQAQALALESWEQARRQAQEELGVSLPALALRADEAVQGWRLDLQGIPEAQGQEVEGLPEALLALGRRHTALALGPQEVHQRLEELRQVAPEDVAAVVPARLDVLALTEVMQGLVREQVPVRDLRTLLASVARAPEADPEQRVEAARQGLRRSITWRFCDPSRGLRAWELHPEVEAMLRDCLHRPEQGPAQLRLPAGIRREILAAARRALGQQEAPVVLTSPELRPWAWRLLQAELPQVAVLSYAELLEDVRVEVAGIISVMRP